MSRLHIRAQNRLQENEFTVVRWLMERYVALGANTITGSFRSGPVSQVRSFFHYKRGLRNYQPEANQLM